MNRCPWLLFLTLGLLALPIQTAAGRTWTLFDSGSPSQEAPAVGMRQHRHAAFKASLKTAFDPRQKHAKLGDTISVPLFGSELRSMKVDRIRVLPDNGFFLHAHEANGKSSLFLSYRDGILHGSVQLPDQRTVELDGNSAKDIHIQERLPITEKIDDPVVPPVSSAPAYAGNNSSNVLLLPPSSDFNPNCSAVPTPVVIDLLVIYDPQAEATIGGTAAMRLRAETDVEGMNEALIASQTNTIFRLVAIHQVLWPGENSDAGSALSQAPYLKDSGGTTVPDIRDAVGADEVCFYYNGTSTGIIGEAWIMSGAWVGPSFESQAYAAVSILGPMTTFSHELGHNLGCMHETGTGAYAFSHAFNSGGLRTIMCAWVGNLDLYSSPLTTYNGGVIGDATIHDNARTILLDAPITAAFRSPALPDPLPGVSLTSPLDGSVLPEAQTVNLAATASSSAGITQVDFYYDGILFDTVTTPPYQTVAPLLGPGTHSFWAKATDVNGLQGYSCPVSVTGTTTLTPWLEMDWSNPLVLATDGQAWRSGLSRDAGYPACAAQSGSSLTLFSDGKSWIASDSSLFVYQIFCSDGSITAHVPVAPGAGDSNAVAYLELRQGLGASDASFKIGLNAAIGYEVFTRDTSGVTNYVTEGIPRSTGWLRIVRAGGMLQGYTSPDGTVWTPYGPSFSMALPPDIWGGMEWGGDSNLNLQAVTFDNVAVSSSCALRTSTPTHSPTVTSTWTKTSTPTFTPTRTSSPTKTVTPTFTATLTASPTRTFSSTKTVTSTFSATLTASPTRTFSSTKTATPTFSVTRTDSPTHTTTLTPSTTRSPSDTRTPTVTFSPTRSPSDTRTPTVTFSPTRSPSGTRTPTVTLSPTRSPSGTRTPTVTLSPTPSPSGTRTPSVTLSLTPSPSGTRTSSATISPTDSPSGTHTFSPTLSPTRSVSSTLTITPSGTPTLTATPDVTSTSTATWTPMVIAEPAAPSGSPELIRAELVPNPLSTGSQGKLLVQIKGSVDQVKVEVYSVANICFQRLNFDVHGQTDWVALSLDVSQWPNGLVYLKVKAVHGNEVAYKIAKAYLAR